MQHIQVPVAQEGAPFLIFSALCSLVFALLGLIYPALFFLALTGFVLYFFRDPVRVLPTEAGAIVAPADGKVIVVQEVEDTRFLGERVQKISIFMNVFNVHVNRIPFTGTVQQVRMQPGRFYAADKEKAELHNEYCALTIATSYGYLEHPEQVISWGADMIVTKPTQLVAVLNTCRERLSVAHR